MDFGVSTNTLELQKRSPWLYNHASDAAVTIDRGSIISCIARTKLASRSS